MKKIKEMSTAVVLYSSSQYSSDGVNMGLGLMGKPGSAWVVAWVWCMGAWVGAWVVVMCWVFYYLEWGGGVGEGEDPRPSQWDDSDSEVI